ncbi:hypothetical protein ACR78Z_12840 [Sphingobacterium thalpophilum]|uniref:hypothetical protein n=1 Tax=Sphingobacterium thalpophilum TaxID=259 RepID=UPI003DA5C52E
MSRKLTIPLFSVLFLIVASCSRDEPFNPKPQPEPEPRIEYACPKADDIYKVYPDTFFVTPKGLYIINEKSQ